MNIFCFYSLNPDEYLLFCKQFSISAFRVSGPQAQEGTGFMFFHLFLFGWNNGYKLSVRVHLSSKDLSYKMVSKMIAIFF